MSNVNENVVTPKFLKFNTLQRPEDGFVMEYIDKPAAVGIVVFNSDYSQVLMVNQFRPGPKTNFWEIPAGIVEPDDTPEITAFKELRQETGYEKEDIDDFNFLGYYYVSPGCSTEIIYLYMCRIKPNAKENALQLDPNEKLTKSWMNIEDALKIHDFKTNNGLMKALNRPKRKIGIYGGAFSPVTNLHLMTAERAVEELDLDHAILEPVSDKYIKANMVEAYHRLNMLNLAVKGNNKLTVGTYETSPFHVVQPSSLNTLTHYKAVYGWSEIYFICGSDVLKTMSSWREITNLLENFEIICIQRDNDNVYRDVILKDGLLAKYRKKIHIIYENATNNISSSTIRNLIKSGQSVKYQMPDDVINYINENKLYV